MKPLLSCVTAIGLVIAPISAQAGTRASGNSVTLIDTPRFASPSTDSLELGGGSICRKKSEDSENKNRVCEGIFWLAATAFLLLLLDRAVPMTLEREKDSSFGTGG